jgi:hypothetical protein
MQIEDIKTIEQAKSMCYDQVILLNQTQRNIQILEARIAELSKPETTETLEIDDGEQIQD